MSAGTFSEPGDIYLTRNIPSLNKTLGYWQHSAISNGRAVIEGQAEPGCVILVMEVPFRRRNPEHLLLRPKDKTIGKEVAELAQTYIGVKYDAKTFNCVTLVRSVYKEILGWDPRWISPNQIARSILFEEVEHLKDYEHWIQPADWYEGRIE